MQAILTILNREFSIDCSEQEERRLQDLAKELETRLKGCSGDDPMRRLVLTSLLLMDETQAAYAALARARCEIERMTDMLVEAKLEAEAAQTAPDTPDRGRVGSLRRVAEGAA